MYYANTGYAMAPATSANDSEQQSMSSDAETVSLTDSSVYVFSDLTQICTYTHTQMHAHSRFSHEIAKPQVLLTAGRRVNDQNKT